MNRLSWIANRIRGLEPRSATPAASSIVLAKADGTIDREWTPSVAWTDTANTFTASQTISSAGSSSSSPRSLTFSAAAGEFSRFGFASTSNSIQSGNGQLTQINSYYSLVLSGDRLTSPPSYIAGSGGEDVSTRIISSRAVSRPLVVQGAASQTANLTEWRNSTGLVFAAIGSGGLFFATNGSITNPSIAFINDPDTGFFGGSNDTLQVTTGGVRMAYMDNRGLSVDVVGIGTNSAYRAFHTGGFTQHWENRGEGGIPYRWVVTNNSYTTVGGGKLILTENTTTITSAILTVFSGKFGFGVGNHTPKATIHGIGSTILGAATSAVADADMGNGQINLYLDESGHNLKVKAKYSNGTIRTATIALVA